MTENDNQPRPPAPPPPPPASAPAPGQEPPEAGLREELARVRSRSNLLTIVAVVLGTLFVLLAGAGYMVYLKINQAKENIEEVFNAFPAPAPGYQPGGAGQFSQGVRSSTGMPASSLGLFSGGLPGEGQGGFPGLAITQEQAEQVKDAMLKYADRPIVKEFIADLKKNPDMAEAFAATKDGNPLAVVSKIQNARGMEKVAMKYAARPEFLKLMMEVMNDPGMAPVLKGLPPGMGLGARPAAPAPVPSIPAPASRPEREEGEMRLDTTAISGPPKATGSPQAAPSPIDRE